MATRETHRRTIIEYIGDWDNPFPTRLKMAEICGVKPETLRKHFTPADYTDLENKGLELRKQQSAIPRADVYASMLSSAKDGVVPAQKEFLDRTEGKIIEKIQHGFDEATLNTILNTLPPEQAEKTKAALMAIAKKK